MSPIILPIKSFCSMKLDPSSLDRHQLVHAHPVPPAREAGLQPAPAPLAVPGGHLAGHLHGDVRVVHALLAMGAHVAHLVAEGLQVQLEHLLALETAVVGAQGHVLHLVRTAAGLFPTAQAHHVHASFPVRIWSRMAKIVGRTAALGAPRIWRLGLPSSISITMSPSPACTVSQAITVLPAGFPYGSSGCTSSSFRPPRCGAF